MRRNSQSVAGTYVELQNAACDLVLLGITLLSLWLTPDDATGRTQRAVRISPDRGDGLPHEAAYFWLTGVLSAFLDNAPTYLVLFELAGGDATQLMGPLAGTLAAISMGAVYMGALTYIGNAPNFMVYAIAEEDGIRMPSFFGYLFYAPLILVPLFLLPTLLSIAPILKLG